MAGLLCLLTVLVIPLFLRSHQVDAGGGANKGEQVVTERFYPREPLTRG